MTGNERQTVLVIDDHPLVRYGLRRLLELGEDFRFVGEAADGATGLDHARQLNPDLILLDVNMKGMDGIETLKAIKAADLDSQVIMLTVSDDEHVLVNALRSGADGYLLKTVNPDHLYASLCSATKGQFTLSEGLTRRLADALHKDTQPTDLDKAGLTDREWEVVKLIAEEGLGNKDIARRLGISDGTVKQHVKNVLRKTKLRSRLGIVVWTRGKGQNHGG